MAYTMTKTQKLAVDFAEGKATVDQVVASARAGAKGDTGGVGPADGYDEIMARMETDDAIELNLAGWDGVVSVFNSGVMTSDQFRALHAAYVGGRKK